MSRISPYLYIDENNLAKLSTANAFTVGGHTIASEEIGVVPLVLKGASGQTGALQQWQEFGTTPSQVNSTGQFRIRTFANSFGFTALGVGAGASTELGIVVRGAASQSADMVEIHDNSANILAGISATGRIVSGVSQTTSLGSLLLGAVNTVAQQLGVVARETTTVGAVIRGASGQSANLTEWQNSGGVALATLASNGNFSAIQLNTANLYASLREENSGGFLRLTKQTAIGATLATNQAKIYLRDGTTAGTLKLVVRAGASGVEETLFDNLDQTGTSTIAIGSGVRATDATVATGSVGLGYMGLPQNATTTGSYTVVAADAGKHIYASANRTVTINSNANLALPIGTTLTFIAGAGATMTIAITTDTMYLAGAGTTGSRTLAAHGIATAVKTTATTWLISGNGLT